MINVLFFGQLREQLDCDALTIDLDKLPVKTIEELIKLLSQRGELWQQLLQQETTLVACNHEVVKRQASIKVGDEVAFFPPVTGG
ncbi:molybdopterin converting factor subunit 1 [Zooshikella marina]|uniref:molybdopterin converting factor subunit 1 n=1 Tax=Zooshikella ganghwensis TaxID=202772 RepID=UPI0003F9203B|nr:molybdopterin converting factor subunit 1 [Zooshikella ganghwensis]MBU2705583.1 molybdopterin converting factor subunit 1 [Zooshikella ganghwensis]